MTDEPLASHLRLLAQVEDYATRYLSAGPQRSPFPTPQAIAALTAFEETWPTAGAPARDVIAQLDRYGSPATVMTTGGRHFGFVMGGCLPVALAANWMAGVWDQNVGGWMMSPIGAKLEEIAAGWLLEALDLPRDAEVGFVTGATTASFAALAAARAHLLKRAGWDLRKQGARNAPPLRILASAEEHPAVHKALTMLGVGEDEVERLPTDDHGRILTRDLPQIDDRTLVLVQAGNINSGAFDPFPEICKWAHAANAWVHVDGAFGLWARASHSTKALAQGIELANSWAVDGHKWLNLPYESAVYICREKQAILDVFGADAPYLVRRHKREPNNLTPELSRRARGIEFWAALKFLGRDGVERLVDQCCAHARQFANGLRAAGYEILNDVVLNQVVAAYGDEEEMARIIERIQSDGVCWLGPTRWKGRYALRVSVSSWMTTHEDVERSIASIAAARRS